MYSVEKRQATAEDRRIFNLTPDQNTVIIRETDSLLDMVEDIDRHVRKTAGKSRDLSQTVGFEEGRGQWRGTDSWQECMDIVRNGWSEGTERMAKVSAEITGKLATTPTDMTWDVTGDLFDVGALMSGEPEHWLNTHAPEAKRTIKLVVNCTSSGHLSGVQYMNRGAAIVSLVDALQNDPENIVDLSIIEVTDWSSRYAWTLLSLGTSPLPVDSIAFATAHASYPRRIMFALNSVDNDYRNNVGCVHTVKEEEMAHFLGPDIYYIPETVRGRGGEATWDTVEGAAKWVEDQIKEIEKHLTEKGD